MYCTHCFYPCGVILPCCRDVGIKTGKGQENMLNGVKYSRINAGSQRMVSRVWETGRHKKERMEEKVKEF